MAMQSQNVQEFLLQNKGAAYTSLRTIEGRRKVVQMSKHLTRLRENSLKLYGNITWNLDLRKYLGAMINAYEVGDVSDGELGIVVAVVLDNNQLCFKAFTFIFRDPDVSPCTVFCFGNPRSEPSIKSSNWVKERDYIEKRCQSMDTPIADTILIKDFKLYEGTKTSFFGIIKNETNGELTICTAPYDLVLKGTVGEAVHEICDQFGIQFRFELIDLKNHKLHGAFLTSAFRYIQPIRKLIVLDR
jgi:branched-subunit amino acid aminotransferase/4-amino-4-deoxychorismate lyase